MLHEWQRVSQQGGTDITKTLHLLWLATPPGDTALFSANGNLHSLARQSQGSFLHSSLISRSALLPNLTFSPDLKHAPKSYLFIHTCLYVHTGALIDIFYANKKNGMEPPLSTRHCAGLWGSADITRHIP